jgi:hypothetical protein
MRPSLIINPRSDATFTARVRYAMTGRVDGPDDLARRLRIWYPMVDVHPRALNWEPSEVWYVYRDGLWTSEGFERCG